jgi:hypothetical protein
MSLSNNVVKQHDCFETTFNNSPIYDGIISRLSPASCFWLPRACGTTHRAVGDFTTRVYNINRHLLHLFDDPVKFQMLQAHTGKLISGSYALQFFDRMHYPSSNVDIYVNPGHSKEVGLWLIEQGSYTFKPQETNANKTFLATIGDDLLPQSSIVSMLQLHYGSKSI